MLSSWPVRLVLTITLQFHCLALAELLGTSHHLCSQLYLTFYAVSILASSTGYAAERMLELISGSGCIAVPWSASIKLFLIGHSLRGSTEQ